MRFQPEYIVIHHSATSPHASLDDIRRAHIARGFDDIGYHFLIEGSGKILLGRPEYIEGAHARGINDKSLGVCCIGNFESEPIPDTQSQALVELLLGLAEQFSVPSSRIITHQEVRTLAATATHTQCPGRFLQAVVDEVRSWMNAAFAVQASAPPLVTLQPEQGELIKIVGQHLLSDQRPGSGTLLPQPQDTLLLSVTQSEQTTPRWSTRVTCSLFERSAHFITHAPSWAFLPGPARLRVAKITAGEIDSVPILDSSINLPIWTKFELRRPLFNAHIAITEAQTTQGFILRVSGTIRNTGTATWENIDDECPFRIGMLAFRADAIADSILEMRHEFLRKPLRPGEAAPFNFTVSLLQFSPGRHTIYLNAVSERRFWFTAFGSHGAAVEFDAVELEPFALEDQTRLLNPPASLAKDNSSASLLYIAPTLPLFDRSGGGFRLLELFRILRMRGVHITFLYEQMGTSKPQKYLDALKKLDIVIGEDPLGYISTPMRQRFSLCIVGWYECAERLLSSVRRLLPGTRVAVDSVDIHWLREQRAQVVGASRLSPAEQLVAKERERAAYASADEVWVVSEDERAVLHQEIPGIKARVIGIPCSTHQLFSEREQEERLLFIGGFNHPPNEGAAVWAAEIVRAFNSSTGRTVKLDIVGSAPPKAVSSLHDDKTVFVHGYVPNTDTFFRHTKALLAPLRFGAGVKGKVCEAVCKGVPVLTTSIGYEGLGLIPEESVLTGESTDDFIRLLGRLFDGSIDMERLRTKALERVLAHHGVQAISPVLYAACIAPPVVIAIVTYNARELLQRCLDSVFQLTKYPSYKIAVVSNGCTDGTRELLQLYAERHQAHMDIFLSEENDYFVKPNNFLISHYPDRDVVMINNDIEVLHEGWLANLVDAAYSSSTVAAAGGRLLDGNGLISEAGAEIYFNGTGRNMGRGLPDNHPSVLAFRSVGFVSGCLMYMRRDAIKVVGTLDDTFHPMYFEDAAWNYRAHTLGLKTIYSPWVKAIHLEGSSAGTTPGNNMKRYQEINREKFIAQFPDVEKYNR